MKQVASRVLPWLSLALLGLGVVSSSSCNAQQGEQTGARTAEEEPTVAATTTQAGAPPLADGRTAEEPTAATRGDRADEETNMQLIEAAERGDAEAVRRLLGEGASVDARDANGRTALVAAAYGNHLEAAEALIEAGADVNAKDYTEQSAYLISTSEVGDDVRLLELTLRNGADVGSLDSYNGIGLIRASDRGHVRIVERLLQTETDVDHVNNLGWTALLEAIILGEGDARHTEVVRLLVEGGADPSIPDGEGVTPLQHAEQRGYFEMAEILRSTGS